ncbi:ankyrin repeat domain-containing protein [Altererythrobacter sp. SALINAS58]|nr:ankyrin repeat domain-containing protein [Alteripontixanthobacter muriae]
MGTAGAAMGIAAMLAVQPVQAQMSEGYEFLKAVKDRDGTVVMNALAEPGNTLVNTRDIATGQGVLHIVTARRDTQWIRFLAERGANPNLADKDGITPLVIASNIGFVEGAEALLDAGARVDVTNSAGETPLIAAVHRRDMAMLRLLLDKGADPDRADNSGRTARDYARLSSGSIALAEIEKADAERASIGEPVQTYGPTR